MTKTTPNLKTHSESFFAPPPPSNGKIIGIDCHPDTFTATALRGTTPHDAQELTSKIDVPLDQLLKWLKSYASEDDMILMEAGSNSFELYRRLSAMKLHACVLESAWIGRQASIYVDNDKLASVRIAKVYLQGNCPAVWVPDETTCQRRELLHLYEVSKRDTTQSINSLRGYLTQYAIRPGRKNLSLPRTQQWILQQREWSELQKLHLTDHFSHLAHCKQRQQKFEQQICIEITKEPNMLALMGLLGIGRINAFALIATIGDIRRFANPRKLVAYLGLNPNQKTSGTHKRVKTGVGKRGRKGMRTLLIQGAHSVINQGSKTALGKWGMSLFLRKGHRNIAVAAVARKLSMQVWHLLMGNQPELLESSPSRELKFSKLLTTLGREKRAEMNLPNRIPACIRELELFIRQQKNNLHPKINLE